MHVEKKQCTFQLVNAALEYGTPLGRTIGALIVSSFGKNRNALQRSGQMLQLIHPEFFLFQKVFGENLETLRWTILTLCLTAQGYSIAALDCSKAALDYSNAALTKSLFWKKKLYLVNAAFECVAVSTENLQKLNTYRTPTPRLKVEICTVLFNAHKILTLRWTALPLSVNIFSFSPAAAF